MLWYIKLIWNQHGCRNVRNARRHNKKRNGKKIQNKRCCWARWSSMYGRSSNKTFKTFCANSKWRPTKRIRWSTRRNICRWWHNTNTCNSTGNKKRKQRNRTKGKRKKHWTNRKRQGKHYCIWNGKKR